MGQALNGDTHVTEEQLGEGRRRIHQGAKCVIITSTRASQLFQFDDSAARGAKFVDGCD